MQTQAVTIGAALKERPAGGAEGGFSETRFQEQSRPHILKEKPVLGCASGRWGVWCNRYTQGGARNTPLGTWEREFILQHQGKWLASVKCNSQQNPSHGQEKEKGR